MKESPVKTTNIAVIVFLSIALVFSADQTGREWDLIDSLIGYMDAKTQQIEQGAKH
tara:strand:- start:1062 stop:1229 length:168 start_codon:yes stop_codon:yes gene_type:complete